MHILMYRWRAYNYRDIERTFQLLGHTVENIQQKLGSYDIDEEFQARIENLLDTKRFDMVFTVNYFAVISNACENREIKYVSWTCDNPLISMYHKSIFNKCNYIFTFDQSNYLEFRGMGVERIWYLPLAVDTERLDYLLENADDLYKYQNEISFVGSLYERNSYDKLSYALPDYLKGYFEATMQAQMSISGGNIIEEMLTPDILEQLEEYFHLEKTKDSFSDIGLIFSTTVLGFKIAAVERRRALIALSVKYPVAVYSNSDVSDLIRVQYRGGVDYWSEMPKVFHESKINLNLTIPNIKTGLPLRMWDIMGSGGFLMTNYQAELPRYFKEGEDYVCFEGERDLVEKAGYYLEHEEERKQIARNGYRKVKGVHSYRERLKTMLAILEEEEGLSCVQEK